MTHNGFLRKFFKFIPFWLFLSLFKFAGSIHYTMMSPLGEKVFPVWLVGIFVGASAFMQLCLDIPSGYLADKLGYKRTLMITTLCFIVAASALFFGLTPVTFIATLFGGVFGWLFFTSSANAYVMSQSEGHEVGRMVSIKDTFASVGVVLSGAVIVFAVNWNTTLLAGFIIGILVLAYLVLSRAPREPVAHNHKKEKLHPRFITAAFKTAHSLRPASYLLMITSFTAALFYAIIWFVVPLLIAHDINAKTLSIGLGIFDFAIVILGFTLGRIVDTFNKKLLALLGIIIFAVAGILLGANFGFVFLLLGFLATTGDELTGLSLWSWLYSLNKDHEHYGLVTGVVELWADLGWTIGPILAGFLYTLIGPSWTISVGGIIILINLVMYLFMLRNPLPAHAGTVTHPRHHKQRYHHKNSWYVKTPFWEFLLLNRFCCYYSFLLNYLSQYRCNAIGHELVPLIIWMEWIKFV